MHPAKNTCPSCGKFDGVPLVWGDLDLLAEHARETIGRGEMVCGGDAISCDENGHPRDMACLACGAQWISTDATANEVTTQDAATPDRSIRFEDGEFTIPAPASVEKIIQLRGPVPKRFSHLHLHKQDLKFAQSCLAAHDHDQADTVMMKSLWRSAVIFYAKCFGNSKSRFQLQAKQVLGNDRMKIAAHEFFRDLRNKTFVHDENSYTQSLPCVQVNKESEETKLGNFWCLIFETGTYSIPNKNNLQLLIEASLNWVDAQVSIVCAQIAEDLNKLSHIELIRKPAPGYTHPGVDEISQTRQEG